ncbi:S1C family serine protease [Paenibacillus flagellatus]|uniref:S1C family serine protease n=1 Tax=Paenibacillus flagellatus TaxID=2211139 RepID=UPI00130509E2|nr:serine protease [Paenibacillus flagellatus]
MKDREEREDRPEERKEREAAAAEHEPAYDEADLVQADEADEEEDRIYFERKARTRRRLKKAIAVFVVAALLVNGLAFWPMLYNGQAIRFLVKSRELSRNEAVAAYKQAVVVVGTDEGKGTGFLITPDGYIVTNHHVIEGAKNVFVRLPDGENYIAEVKASEAGLDLAVLKIDPGDRQLDALPLERTNDWREGEPVYIIGNPLMFTRIANEGTIAGQIPVRGLDVPALALQAPVYKGNSGSPVINADGKAIAVVFATAEVELDGEKRHVGLAVSVAHLLPVLEKIGGIHVAKQ